MFYLRLMILRRFILVLLLVILCGSAHFVYAQALNTIVQSNWDDNSLRSGPYNNVYNDIWGYTDETGREYAIMGSADYTLFIDVTDPTNPIEVDRELGGTNCTWRDFKVYKNFAYGVADGCNGNLQIFDLSTLPDSVIKVYDSDSLVFDPHNIFIDTAMGKLYACGLNGGGTDIIILDLTINPDNPSLIKNLDILGESDDYVHDLYVRNDTAYCSHIYQHRLIIYDFSDPDNIAPLGILDSPGSNHSNWVSDNGEVIVVADETRDRPVIIADLREFENPPVLSTFKSALLAPLHTNSVAHNPFIIGNDFVVLSYYEDGLQIYKIDSTTLPFRAGYYDTDVVSTTYNFNGAWGTYPFLPSGNLLASDQENGLYVIKPQFPLKDCNSDVLVEGVYDNHWEFIARDIFSTSAIYQDEATISILAPQEIVLMPNFSISAGSTLVASIDDPCQSVDSRLPDILEKPNGRK